MEKLGLMLRSPPPSGSLVRSGQSGTPTVKTDSLSSSPATGLFGQMDHFVVMAVDARALVGPMAAARVVVAVVVALALGV